MSPKSDEAARLQRALKVYEDFVLSDGEADPEALLDAHEDLRDLLEPLLGLGLGATIDWLKDTTLRISRHEAEGTSSETPRADQIGRYRIIEQIGAGGMGVVFRGEESGTRRSVALKVIKPGMDSQQVQARFDAEKNALSLMNHPNIARVFDSGQTPENRPFFVMEYVAGTPLQEYCSREGLALVERLRLFQQVCDGVQHAHTKGVVHRDLKPDNILVARIDDKAVPKIIDFGLAKALAAPLTDLTMVTFQRQIMGTLEYMSPEQAGSGGSDVDTKTDVYALGVILYELLVDHRPFDLQEKGDEEILRTIREDDPPRPSTRLSQLDQKESSRLAQSRGLDATRLRSCLQGELDWIVLKALEKQRDRRYATPLALADDIERHIAGHEPVVARPPSAGYRLQKFLRRYRGPVLAVAAVLVALIIGFSWALRERHRADDEAAAARIAQKTAEEERGAARESDQQARQALARVLSLSDIKLVSDYTAESEALWPAYPDKLTAMREWLDKARKLVARIPEHEESLGLIRERAVPQSEEKQQRPGTAPPSDELETQENELQKSWTFSDPEDEWQHTVLLELLEALRRFGGDGGQIASVEERVLFAETLAERTTTGRDVKPAWAKAIASVADRAECPLYDGFALQEQLGLVPLDRNPRTGLWEFWHVQTGERPEPNPDWVAETWDPKHPGKCNRWRITDETGLVFVLIPGGTFRMGAERPKLGWELEETAEGVKVTEISEGGLSGRAGVLVGDVIRSVNNHSIETAADLNSALPLLRTGEKAHFNVRRDGEEKELAALVRRGVGSPNIDPAARPNESPVHEVTLGPYFLSKYEMTQGQWSRSPARVKDPSYYKAGSNLRGQAISASHPVEEVSWTQCRELLHRLGLKLPTEAQWEYGCRAGSSSVYWSGDEVTALQGVGNIADRFAKGLAPGWACSMEVDDGYAVHGPVGQLRANPFGLHDVYGGVWEWCRDAYESYEHPIEDANGLRSDDPRSSYRMNRGGTFNGIAAYARSARRTAQGPSDRSVNLGLRPSKGHP